jgi:hypothetical protein
MNPLKEAKAEPQIFLKFTIYSNKKTCEMIMLHRKEGFQRITAYYNKKEGVTQGNYKVEIVSKLIAQ